MRIRVQLFAAPRSVTGQSDVTLELPPAATVRDLREELLRQYPALAPYGSSMKFAIEADYVADDTRVPPGAEVACIPPVSGG